MISITQLDHLVLTVKSIDNTVGFYCDVLGMELLKFGNNRMALKFGTQKINLHEAGSEFAPRAAHATPGSADLCFISETPLHDILDTLKDKGIEIIEGPVSRAGAIGPIESIYVRDCDENLIEISNYS